MSYLPTLTKMRDYFSSGATRPIEFRKQQIRLLKDCLLEHEQAINEALYQDLHKSPEEVWVSETGLVLAECKLALKKLDQWTRPERVRTNLANIPSSSHIMPEPLGVVLIVAPWNYPLELLLGPLVGALAAGNCVVLKPSEFTPATAALMKKIIERVFDERYVWLIEGDGASVVPSLMGSFRFDHLFYTGSTAVGKIVYRMAAEQLTPVTLELGGKSPCVIESDANIEVAAKRIALAKWNNAGQTCIAPDYILVHQSVRERFIEALQRVIEMFYTNNPARCDHYGRIINTRQFDRLVSYLSSGNIVCGGQHDRDHCYISPTVLTDVSLDAPIMQEEIFGPLLPILSYQHFEEAKAIIDRHANPLSFYVYTESRQKEKKWLEQVPAGGACVNNSVFHFLNHRLPFGGRGNSGFGMYHGKHSFNTFSHFKSVLRTPSWIDPAIKYPPFKGKLGLLKKLIG
ncbi:MAG: aldehyde dehydrogenase [Sphingomonadales bacterium]|nr:aldehyde dehydrogenase [Sphingomonadales bacterium]